MLTWGLETGAFWGSAFCMLRIFWFSLSVHFPRTLMRTARWWFPSKGLEETLNGCHCSQDSSRTCRKMKLRALYRRSKDKNGYWMLVTGNYRRENKYLRINITSWFWEDQFHGSTRERSGWNYFDSPSWLAETKKPIKDKKKYSSSSHAKYDRSNVHSQEDNEDYIQLMSVEEQLKVEFSNTWKRCNPH